MSHWEAKVCHEGKGPPRRANGRQKGGNRDAKEAKRAPKVSQESPWDPQEMQKGSFLEPKVL